LGQLQTLADFGEWRLFTGQCRAESFASPGDSFGAPGWVQRVMTGWAFRPPFAFSGAG